MFENVIEDINRYSTIEHHGSGKIKQFIYLFFRQDLWAVIIFRFGRWVTYDFHVPIITQVLKVVYFFLRKMSEILLGVGIWPESEIGPGLVVHYGGVYIKARMGRNCFISQQVIIGHIGGGKGGGVPILGDNVYVGAGAKILGEITIGSNSRIGANAVVIKDVPDNSVAVGIPAKVVQKRTIE